MQTTGRTYNALAVLWLLFGILCAATAAWLIINAPILRLMWGAIITRVPNPFAWMALFHALLLAAIILTLATTIFSIAAGISLMQPDGSAKVWPIVAAIFAVMCGPVGVALGVYTLVLLLPRASGSAYLRVPAAA